MPFTLPRLPLGGFTNVTPEQQQVWWQQVVDAIEAQPLESELPRRDGAIAAIEAAQAAADAANTAATAANTAAASAQTTADGITESNELSNSWVTGATITATDAGTDVTITISAHTRHYPQPDGTTVDVAVDAGTLTGEAYDTTYYISYSDPARAGGAVTYIASVTEPAQIGDIHVVGASTPVSSGSPPSTGNTVRPPGSGSIGSTP